MKEVWKPIENYEGLYEVSNIGNVRSLPRVVRGNYGSTQPKRGRMLKHSIDKDGYHQVVLSKDAKTKHYRVHRLVAMAFIPNPNNHPQINHINEKVDDNRVENLEWVTCTQNINHGSRTKRMSKTRKGSGVLGKPVLQIDTNTGEILGEYKSCEDAARQLKGESANGSMINHCCRKKAKTAYGYKWQYK